MGEEGETKIKANPTMCRARSIIFLMCSWEGGEAGKRDKSDIEKRVRNRRCITGEL